MKRIYLNTGDTLELNNRNYTVGSVIGDGATCVVYSAKYKDKMGFAHSVNIKECYPYNANISRVGTLLNWASDEEKNEHLKKFVNTYEKLMKWQDANEIINVFDICEQNNSVYLVMEPNKKSVTFDKYKPESLGEILSSIKRLSAYVGDYHNKGFLHLDIKPSNFLIVPGETDRITLFDLDTVTAILDIETGEYKYVSYSDSWAAPEQKQGKIHKLCPATDIYAIGAVLFEKIMGRQVNNDDIGYFAEWSFDGQLFENVNPKIKRLLTNIFKKTLAASVKRRYQTTDTLIKDLNHAIKIAQDEVYLKGDDICCSGCFIGREDELKQIKKSFDNKKKAVFLHGFGGIGKTEIARKFAELYKKDYDVILFVKYDNNSTLQEKLDEIDIVNFDGELSEKRNKLRSLLDDKTLVIVDNFDVEIGVDNGLKYLFDTKAHILVSTRTDFSSVYNGDKYTQIEIKELAGNELEQVFLRNAKIEYLSYADKDFLYKIFKLIENHTYATELLAKQMYYSGWSLEMLYNKVKSGFSALAKAERVVANKDEDTQKDNSLNILRTVFSLSNLTNGQKQVLMNLYLLRFMDISDFTYTKYTLENSIKRDALNDLVEIGLLKYDRVYYTLHPLVEELVAYDLQPNLENCVGVYSIVNSKIFNTINYDRYDEADEFEFDANCEFLCAFFNYVDLKVSDNRILLIRWLLELYKNENITVRFFDYSFPIIYKKLLQSIENDAISDVEKSDIFFVLVNAWLTEFYMIYGGDSETREALEMLREEKITYYYKLALDNCLILEDNLKSIHIDRLVKTIIDFSIGLASSSLPIYIIEDLYSRFPKYFEDVSVSDRSKMGLKLSETELEELKREEQELPDVFKPGYTNEKIDMERYVKNSFNKSDNKIAYITDIINNKNYSPMYRAELLWYCTNSVFESFHLGFDVNNIDKFDWNTFGKILEIEEEFLISDVCTADANGDDDWIYYLDDNTVNQIIVNAAICDYDCFEENIDILLNDIGRKASWFIEKQSCWSRFLKLRDHVNFSLDKVNNALEVIKKSHLMLPVLIRFIEGWENYARRINDYSERDFFSLYKAVAECAELASVEKDIDPKYIMDFHKIEYYYRDKMDSIAGIDYSLKFED